MKWRVEFRSEVEPGVVEATGCYDAQQPVRGRILLIKLFAFRMLWRNIRWRYPERFPYRVVYEVVEAEHAVIVAAVGPRLAMNGNGGGGYEAA